MSHDEVLPDQHDAKPGSQPGSRHTDGVQSGVRRARGRWFLAALAAAAVALAIALILINMEDDDGAETTSGSSIPATTATSPGTTLTDAEAATVVWPTPGAATYDDPATAVRDFAEELIGFSAPQLGEFQQGDSRSGEIAVQPNANGPTTTVLVRRMSDDSWYVTGSSAADIVLDEPAAGSAIDHPLQVAGTAATPSGEVEVRVFVRGQSEPLGQGAIATSRGSVAGPFTGEVSWVNPGGGWGSVVAVSVDPTDGEALQGTAVPVGFIGGD